MMDVGAVEVAAVVAAEAAAAGSAVSGIDWTPILIAILSGVVSPLVLMGIGWFNQRQAAATTRIVAEALKTSEETKAVAVETRAVATESVATTKDIKVQVDGRSTAMEFKIEQLTALVLTLTADKAAADARLRAHEMQAEIEARVAARMVVLAGEAPRPATAPHVVVDAAVPEPVVEPKRTEGA